MDAAPHDATILIAPDSLVEAGRFNPCLTVPTRPDGRVPSIPEHAPCEWCCHWSLPLTRRPRLVAGHFVAMTFHEWLVWHWHVQNHQGGVPLS